jgi:hypothetical protein
MTARSQLGVPQKRGPGHWFVPSGKVGYHVRWSQGRYSCTCPSGKFRPHLACRHIAAVRKMRQEVAMG